MEHPLTRLYRKNLATLIMLLPDKEDKTVQVEQPRLPGPTDLPADALKARELFNVDRRGLEEQVPPHPSRP